VALVVGGVPHGMRLGIVVGTISALFVALFSSLNKRLVEHADPLTVTAVELGAGTLALTLVAPMMPMLFPAFAGTLFVLPGSMTRCCCWRCRSPARCCHSRLSLVALRHMSAFAAQLAVNLEPVYAIVLAMLLLGEQHELTTKFYAGVAIILGAVLVYPMISRARPLGHPEVLGTAEAKGAAE
jgi:drug/metabolite transporter (DMT)-like permease